MKTFFVSALLISMTALANSGSSTTTDYSSSSTMSPSATMEKGMKSKTIEKQEEVDHATDSSAYPSSGSSTTTTKTKKTKMDH